LSSKSDLYSIINKLAEKGVSILLYSSDDVELLTYSDRILVFNNGKVSRLLKGLEKNKYNLYEASYDNRN
jgi:ribose transport system ATP-binding protein